MKPEMSVEPRDRDDPLYQPHRMKRARNPDDYFNILAYICQECGAMCDFANEKTECPVDWQDRKGQYARTLAIGRLTQKYGDEFDALVAEERAKL